jgi:hypothetical protein
MALHGRVQPIMLPTAVILFYLVAWVQPKEKNISSPRYPGSAPCSINIILPMQQGSAHHAFNSYNTI